MVVKVMLMFDLSQASDEELMLRYGRGNADAFAELYGRHKGALYRLMLRSCESQALAEELYQDVWAGVIDARERYKATAKFATWLYSVAHHRLVDHYRKQGRWDDCFSSDDDDAAACAAAPEYHEPERQTDINRQIATFLSCLEQLPAPQREVFLLREEAGLTASAIAAVAGAGLEAIKSRMRYAISGLRRCMEGSL
jgi:RNA polymerase sigma-70 factor (ECF subfamily)